VGKISLVGCPHDRNDADEALPSPKKQPNAMPAILRSQIVAIKARSYQFARVRKDVADMHEFASRMRGKISIERLQAESAIRYPTRPSHDPWPNRIVLKRKTQ
jgi:hypothetical protein